MNWARQTTNSSAFVDAERAWMGLKVIGVFTMVSVR